jgi:hypothetical protein
MHARTGGRSGSSAADGDAGRRVVLGRARARHQVPTRRVRRLGVGPDGKTRVLGWRAQHATRRPGAYSPHVGQPARGWAGAGLYVFCLLESQKAALPPGTDVMSPCCKAVLERARKQTKQTNKQTQTLMMQIHLPEQRGNPRNPVVFGSQIQTQTTGEPPHFACDVPHRAPASI